MIGMIMIDLAIYLFIFDNKGNVAMHYLLWTIL